MRKALNTYLEVFSYKISLDVKVRNRDIVGVDLSL